MMWWGGKNLLCKLTLDGAFSLAIEIRFRLSRVLASKSPPMPAKNKTNLAKTPQFPRFLSNSHLKYI